MNTNEKDKVMVVIRELDENATKGQPCSLEAYAVTSEGALAEPVFQKTCEDKEEARSYLDSMLRWDFNVVQIMELKEGDDLPEELEPARPLFPEFVTYKIGTGEFEFHLQNFLRNEKGIELSFSIQSEGADDAELPQFWIDIPQEENDEKALEALADEYGFDLSDEFEVTKYILQDVFHSYNIEYYCDWGSQILYIHAPMAEYERLKKAREKKAQEKRAAEAEQ